MATGGTGSRDGPTARRTVRFSCATSSMSCCMPAAALLLRGPPPYDRACRERWLLVPPRGAHFLRRELPCGFRGRSLEARSLVLIPAALALTLPTM